MEKKVSLISRWVAAIILLQTLFFKFSGAEVSVYIFTKVGMEPWGRYATGAAELVAAILLLLPATKSVGALLSLGIICGAVFSHLTVLGIDVMGDGGRVFYLAVAVFVCSLTALVIHRKEIPFVGEKL